MLELAGGGVGHELGALRPSTRAATMVRALPFLLDLCHASLSSVWRGSTLTSSDQRFFGTHFYFIFGEIG